MQPQLSLTLQRSLHDLTGALAGGMACGVSRIYKELVVWGWDEQASIWDRHVDVSYKEASLCWTDSYQNEIVVMPIGTCTCKR